MRTTRTAGLAVAVMLLGGCEAIAGIDDLQLLGDASESGSADAGGALRDAHANDALMPADDGTGPLEDGSFDESADESSLDGSAGSDEPGNDGGSSDDGAPGVGDAQAHGPDATGVADGGSAADASPEVGADGAGPPTLELIDDMEQNNGALPGWLDGVNASNPRSGTWFVYSDGSDGGVLSPSVGSSAASVIDAIDGGRGTSLHAAHVSGNGGFTVFGAGMGFDLNLVQTKPQPYDASAYAGVTFWVRSTNAVAPYVRLNLLDANTADPGSGGTCDGGACSGFWGHVLPPLTSSWQQVTVTFAALTRPQWAVPDGMPLDTAHLIGFEFQVNPGESFDLWIDDVYFVDK